MAEASRRMFRYVVPVDDAAHVIDLSHDPVAVAAVTGGYGDTAVEFWAEHTEGVPLAKRAFRVLGTGQQLPEGARWTAICPRTPLGLVLHLSELPFVGRRMVAVVTAAAEGGGS